jgi:hypothetical protein
MTFLIVSSGLDISGSIAASTAGTCKRPSGITTNGMQLYIAETGSYTIWLVVISTGKTSTLAGSSSGFAGFTDGTGASALF